MRARDLAATAIGLTYPRKQTVAGVVSDAGGDLTMYYVMIAEHSAPAVARNIARADTSTAARRLAVAMDLTLHGRPSGRLFYLDQETYLDWCARGKAVGDPPLPVPDVEPGDAAGAGAGCPD